MWGSPPRGLCMVHRDGAGTPAWDGPETCPHCPEACTQVLSASPALPSYKERTDSDSSGWSLRISRKGAKGSLGCPRGGRPWLVQTVVQHLSLRTDLGSQEPSS